MSEEKTLAEFELLIRAHYALIVIETVEPERAEELVREAAARLNLHYYYWTRSKGVRRGNSPGESCRETSRAAPGHRLRGRAEA